MTESLYVDRFYVMDPEFDDVLFSGAELREGFLARYPDGTKRLRSYDASYGWIVKKGSM